MSAKPKKKPVAKKPVPAKKPVAKKKLEPADFALRRSTHGVNEKNKAKRLGNPVQPLKRAASKPREELINIDDQPPAKMRDAEGAKAAASANAAIAPTSKAAKAAAIVDAAKATAETKATRFFDGHDDKLVDLLAPGVYREAGGSHTTILLYVGRTKAQHTPMDSAGLRVVSTNVRDFRETWLRAPYPVEKAAEKYLQVGQFDVAARARAALEVVAAGGDAAAIKAALDRKLDIEDVPAAGDLASGLLAAGASKKPKRGGGNLPKGRGIGAWVCEQLVAKVPDAKILTEVVKLFPGAKTNQAHLMWYRNKLKRDGSLS